MNCFPSDEYFPIEKCRRCKSNKIIKIGGDNCFGKAKYICKNCGFQWESNGGDYIRY